MQGRYRGWKIPSISDFSGGMSSPNIPTIIIDRGDLKVTLPFTIESLCSYSEEDANKKILEEAKRIIDKYETR